MNSHKHARLTASGRALLCQRVLQQGWKVLSASEAAGVSLRTAYKALANPRIRYFGGWDEGQLVSSCTLTIIPNLTRACRPYGVIENVVTHTVHRGDGWGRALLQRTLAHAWRERCYKVMLMTGRKDENTLRFYEQAGFDRHGKQAFVAKPPQ